MPLTSVIIPSRNEQFLVKTVEDLLTKPAGDLEVIVVLDGYWEHHLPEDPRVTIIHWGQNRGMRAAVNAGATAAGGQYLMKLDAHCLVPEGFDVVLQEDCDDDWVVVPRRKSLDPEQWCVSKGRPNIDYHYLSWPYTHPESPGLHGRWWRDRQEQRKDLLIDEEMSSQGSGWFMTRNHWERLGGLSEEGYGTFIQEFQEIGMKTWLGGGKVMVNKKTWYAHLHKGRRYGRGYSGNAKSWARGRLFSADYWVNNRWEARQHDFDWLIERFWPVPTWPENWKDHDYSGLAAS